MAAPAETRTVAPSDRSAAPRARARALLRACRPRQWTKNLLVLAAPCAAGVIGRAGVAGDVAGAFVVMCAASSATYLVNDVRDVEQDRVHPVKRHRPIAAGEVSTREALVLAAALALLSVGGGAVIAPGLGAVALLYLALTLSYSIWWRGIVALDLLAIAAGFVLRPLAGGVASDIYLSRWFVLVTGFGAIFLVAAKRFSELRDTGTSLRVRATLRRYSARWLLALLAGAAIAAGAAYIGWVATRPSHLVWYGLSVVPFIGWLVRYAQLVAAGAGQAPEELILRDRLLLTLSVTWSVLFLGGVYVHH